MKKSTVYIIFGVLILSIGIVIFLNYCDSCKSKQRVHILSGIEKNSKENFSELVCSLQPRYALGYKGRYEPVPDGEQPINALPFNVGLKPCDFTNI